MRNLRLIDGTPSRAAGRAGRRPAGLRLATALLALANVGEARAAGFSPTPAAVVAGEPFTFDVAMGGIGYPDGYVADGSEWAVQIRINVDRTSPTPGNCVATRILSGLSPIVPENWGRDWLVTGPDASWTYPGANGECNGTNGLGPGDYVASLDYYRANGDGSATLQPPIDKKITVLDPLKVTITSDNFVVGGSVQIDIDTAGSGAAGWTASAQSLSIAGPCAGTLTFPDGATSWGVHRTVTFPSAQLPGSCGNLGWSGDHLVGVSYRLRFPSGGSGNAKVLDTSFKIRPIVFTVLPPTVLQRGSIGVNDLIAAGQYGEKITSLTVTCPDDSVDEMPADRLQAMNDGLGAGNPGAVRLWPGPSFDGPCEPRDSGTYTVTLTTLHHSLSSEFTFVDPHDPTDTDGDGWTDVNDNCREVVNPDQKDFDEDYMGDACDGDDDNDQVPDSRDNCPQYVNPHGEATADQTDTDRDGMGDLCDPDDDNDGVLDAADNCRTVANPGRSNADDDLLGDACDPDDDNDGLSDEQEAAAGTDPATATPLGPGINPYAGGQPTGTSNPATAGEKVGVAISAPATVDAVAVTVTDPGGKTAFQDTLIPRSPVVFAFTPDVAGTWTISADLRAAGVSVETLTTSIVVVERTSPLSCRSARCTLEAALHGADCAGQVVPAPIVRKVDRAVALIELAATSPPKKARRLLGHAAGSLSQVGKAATRAAKGRKPRLTPGCATTIGRTVKGMRSSLGL